MKKIARGVRLQADSSNPAAASARRATARLADPTPLFELRRGHAVALRAKAEAKRRREAGPHGVGVVALSLFVASSMVDGMQALPRTIAKGDQSSIESPAQVLARTEAEWTA